MKGLMLSLNKATAVPKGPSGWQETKQEGDSLCFKSERYLCIKRAWHDRNRIWWMPLSAKTGVYPTGFFGACAEIMILISEKGDQ